MYMYALPVLNKMERKMCAHLGWDLQVDPTVLRKFEAKIRWDFKQPPPMYTSLSPALLLASSLLSLGTVDLPTAANYLAAYQVPYTHL